MKPSFTNRFRQAVNTFRGVNKNNAQLLAARQFLKYGNRQIEMPNWSQTIMSDSDMYSGLMYGAINIRAVTVAQLASDNLKTEASQPLMDQAKAKREELEHPYLELIDKSPTFSNYKFWYDISTFIDLEGIAYIMAIRNQAGSLTGKIQEFKLLNPYFIKRNFDTKTGELLGYEEVRGSTSRAIPIYMMIPIINLNPFDESPFAMTDAAKDHQFTLKTANDYTRTAISGNINAPGIISTDAILEGEELANFKARVTGHQKGEPLFGGGAGSITWNDMQSDLNKAALTDVNTISLQNIIAASGASKTMLGIEESGTTRDTSATQKDNFISLRAMPQLQLIIDSLNQDYKNFYPEEYATNQYKICIENPLASDVAGEGLEIDNRQKGYDLYLSLKDDGYEESLSARYADGEVSLEELGKPTNEPKPSPLLPLGTSTPPTQTPAESPPPATAELKDYDKHLQAVETGLLKQVQSSLQNTIINLDNHMLSLVVNHINKVKNQFDSQSDVLPESEKNRLISELGIALAAFYGIILPLQANNTAYKRLEQYGKSTNFKMNNQVRAFIKETASKASTSHVDTLLNAMMEQAQKEALAGIGRDQIALNLLNDYSDEITRVRAVRIARTESNRAFSMGQYQADLQFMNQNDLQGQLYKKWVTTSGNPCEFCQALEAEDPIPLEQPFAEVGDELTAITQNADGQDVVKVMSVDFMDLEAGNAHPNCACEYELIMD